MQDSSARLYSPEGNLTSAIFDSPLFADNVVRPALLSDLESLINSNAVVSVEGLTGTGKTYLVASYAERITKSSAYKSVLWYTPQEEETIDNLFASLDVYIQLSGTSIASKCKQLLHFLRANKILLVVDNYHSVDKLTYSELIEVAVGYGSPAWLVLISQIYVDLLRSIPRIGHIPVGGFQLEEMYKLLTSRGLSDIDASILHELLEKTDGLPLAGSLFATLVADFGRSPRNLLSGTMYSTERLVRWFQDVSSLIGAHEKDLLKVLSICDGPFNYGVIHLACNQLNLNTLCDQTYDRLQRSYLVQKYTPYRSTIHQLVARLCRETISDSDFQRFHVAFAHYYLKGFGNSRNLLINEEEYSWKVRACWHFQKAKQHHEAERLIENIQYTAKLRGYYNSVMSLCKTEIQENPNHSAWMKYHYAHCCLITGYVREGIRTLEAVRYQLSSKDTTKHLSFVRLHAELLATMGDPETGLRLLRNAMLIAPQEDANHVTLWSHAKSIEVMLLTILGGHDQIEEACNLCNELLASNIRNENKRGVAISLTRLGTLERLQENNQQASEHLHHAMDLFLEVEDRRGLAWAKFELTLAMINLGKISDVQDIRDLMEEAIRICSEIGECSIGYWMFLKEINSLFERDKLGFALDIMPNISSEISRVKNRFNG